MATCEACSNQVRGLYQRSTDRKWVCFGCLPACDVDRYPGWRERQAKLEQRAARARANFGHEAKE